METHLLNKFLHAHQKSHATLYNANKSFAYATKFESGQLHDV